MFEDAGSAAWLATALCAFLFACAPDASSDPPVEVSELAAQDGAPFANGRAQDGGLYVGGPCQRTDGWQPPKPDVGITLDGSPVAPSLPDAAWLDYNQLPPGIGYCIAPGSVYPDGYFTMNCSADAECPIGTFCEGVGQCRRQCFGNADCSAGTTCCATPLLPKPGNDAAPVLELTAEAPPLTTSPIRRRACRHLCP